MTCVTICPGCNVNESWETIGHPCLACQNATIIHCFPFGKRVQQQWGLWLANIDTDDSNTDNTLKPKRLQHYSEIKIC